jgi:hypothetical protein
MLIWRTKNGRCLEWQIVLLAISIIVIVALGLWLNAKFKIFESSKEVYVSLLSDSNDLVSISHGGYFEVIYNENTYKWEFGKGFFQDHTFNIGKASEGDKVIVHVCIKNGFGVVTESCEQNIPLWMGKTTLVSFTLDSYGVRKSKK